MMMNILIAIINQTFSGLTGNRDQTRYIEKLSIIIDALYLSRTVHNWMVKSNNEIVPHSFSLVLKYTNDKEALPKEETQDQTKDLVKNMVSH